MWRANSEPAAVSIDPGSASGYTLKAFALYHLCQHSAATIECNNALRVSPTCVVSALNVRALCNAASGNFEEAMRDLDEARSHLDFTSIGENELVTLWNLAEVKFLKGDLSGALIQSTELELFKPSFKGKQ